MFQLQSKCYELPPKKEIIQTTELELSAALQIVIAFWESSDFNDSQLGSNINRHFNPLDNPLKKTILHDLLHLIDFVKKNCPDKRHLVIAQLNEPIKECTAGLVTQLNILKTMLIQGTDIQTLMSITFENLMGKVIQDCMTDWDINEVHTHNYLMVLASNLRLGIKSGYPNDEHLSLGKELALTASGMSEAELQEVLQSQFMKKCTDLKFLQELILVIQQQLSYLGYTGPHQTSYEYSVYSSIQLYFDQLLKKDKVLTPEELFMIDSETYEIKDINWISVLFQLTQYLKQEQFIHTEPDFDSLMTHLQNAHHLLDKNIHQLLEKFFILDHGQIVPFFALCKSLGDEKRKILLEDWLLKSPNPCGDVLEFFKCEDTNFFMSMLPSETDLIFSKPIQLPNRINPLTIITFLATLPPERKVWFLNQIPCPEHSSFFAEILHYESFVFNKLLMTLMDIPPADIALLCPGDNNPLQLLFMASQALEQRFRNAPSIHPIKQISERFSLLCTFLRNLGCFESMFTTLIEDPNINALMNLDLGWEVNIQVLQLTQQLNKTLFVQKIMQLDSDNNNLIMIAVQKPDNWFVQLIGLINQTNTDLLYLMFCQTNLERENIFTLAHRNHLPIICNIVRNLPLEKRSTILSLMYKTKSIFCSKNKEYINLVTPLLMSLDPLNKTRIIEMKDKNGLNLLHYAVIHSSFLFNKLLELNVLEKSRIIKLLLNVGDGLNKNCLMLAFEHQPNLCKTIIEYCVSSEELTNQFFRCNENGETLWHMAIKYHSYAQAEIIMFYLGNLNFTKAFLQEQLLQNPYENFLVLCSNQPAIKDTVSTVLNEIYQTIPDPKGQIDFLNVMLRCLLQNSNMCFFIEKLLSDIPSAMPHLRNLTSEIQLRNSNFLNILMFSDRTFQLFIDAIPQSVFKNMLLDIELYYNLNWTSYDRFTYLVQSQKLAGEVCQFLKELPGDFNALITRLEQNSDKSGLSFFSPSAEPKPAKKSRDDSPPKP